MQELLKDYFVEILEKIITSYFYRNLLWNFWKKVCDFLKNPESNSEERPWEFIKIKWENFGKKFGGIFEIVTRCGSVLIKKKSWGEFPKQSIQDVPKELCVKFLEGISKWIFKRLC